MSPRRRPTREAPASSGRQTAGFRRRMERASRVERFLTGKPLVVGLDLGKSTHAVWVTARDLVPIERFTIEHSLDGLAKLLARSKHLQSAEAFDRAVMFMETTSHFWKNVANVLERHAVPYRLIPPLAVDRKREIAHLTYAKGDYRDAELIARLGTEGHWLDRVLERHDDVWNDLAALAREHENLLDLEIREKHRARTFLELILPEFLEVFTDPFLLTARALLRHVLSEPLRTHGELRGRVACFKAGGKGARRIQAAKARRLSALLELAPSYGVERCLSAASTRLRLALERLDALEAQRESVRGTLLGNYEQVDCRKWLDTIPGVDPIANALLLGLIGDPRRYERPTCLAKLAGIEPRENHSGAAEGDHSISRRGLPLLRAHLFRVVFGFLNSNDEFAAYIKRLVNRTENPLTYHQAFVAAENKFLRLVHALCSKGVAYDPKRVTGAHV
jgi:transposase